MKYLLLAISLVCLNQVDAYAITLKFTDHDTGKVKVSKTDTISVTGNEITEPDRVSIDVDEPAKFKGGNDSLRYFLHENIIYPDTLMERGISGKTIVQFVVEKDGRISNVRILKSSGYESFDREAIRVIKLLNGRFYPALINGKPVRAFCNLPIVFEVINDE